MELELRQQKLPYLAPVAMAAQNLEESAECIVPDASPDIDRVLDTTGMILLREKTCQEGRCTANGVVRAWVIYLAEGEDTPRRLELSIPFAARVEEPSVNDSCTLCFRGTLRNIDTRVVNPRKVSIRANMTAEMTAYKPSELGFTGSAAATDGVQCRTEQRRVVIPAAASEKAFVVSDELELPQGMPSVREVLGWNAALALTDRRLIGEKAVFKGEAAVDLLYTTDTGALEEWQTRLPFSQYMDLPGAMEDDIPEVTLVLTGAELSPDGAGSRLQLSLNAIAQCLASTQRELKLLTDLYSTKGEAAVTMEDNSVESLLDCQHIRQDCRETVAFPKGRPIAARVLVDVPNQRREADTLTMASDALLSVLYLDESEQLQSASRRTTIECWTELAPGCVCRPAAALSGDVQCSPVSDGAELRFAVEFTAPCYSATDVSSITSCQLTQTPEQGRRPSLIVRTVREGETLWSLAKECKSGVEAIREANALEGEVVDGMLLLIPV